MPEGNEMKKYIVVDIDGTIANGEHRVHHLLQEPKDWDSYFSKCDGDKPIRGIVDIVKTMGVMGFCVVYCTGRRDSEREKTKEWLNKHDLPCSTLLMRKTGDCRHDTAIKPELLASVAITPKNTAFILEDRNSVVKKWRELGFTCLQVADGDF